MEPHGSKPHALVIPYPAQGHIGPMMHLSMRLAAQGFTVTFINTQHNHALLKHMQPTLQQQGLDIRLEELHDDRESGSTSGEQAVEPLSMAFFALEPLLDDLVERLLQASPPLSCMVSDLYLHFTQNVANKFQLRRLAFWTASAGTLACMMAVKQGLRGPKEATESNPNKLITWIPGVPPLTPDEFNTYLRNDDPEDFMFKMFVDPCRRIKETTWVALNTVEELEQESLDALRQECDVWTVGPMLPRFYFGVGEEEKGYCKASLWEEEHSCVEWLEQQEAQAVLYISFGSIAILSAEQFSELALGLEASGVPLLWVIRADLMHGEHAIFPEAYLERVKGRSCFVSWAPQMQVLTHKAVGGFLTHCGWNSILESIAAGVPMLGWPYFADQMLNNRCCVDKWKIGLDFQAGRDGMISRGEVESKVRALMQRSSSSSSSSSSAKWKEAFRRAVAEDGSSTRYFTDLVNALSQPPS